MKIRNPKVNQYSFLDHLIGEGQVCGNDKCAGPLYCQQNGWAVGYHSGCAVVKSEPNGRKFVSRVCGCTEITCPIGGDSGWEIDAPIKKGAQRNQCFTYNEFIGMVKIFATIRLLYGRSREGAWRKHGKCLHFKRVSHWFHI